MPLATTAKVPPGNFTLSEKLAYQLVREFNMLVRFKAEFFTRAADQIAADPGGKAGFLVSLKGSSPSGDNNAQELLDYFTADKVTTDNHQEEFLPNGQAAPEMVLPFDQADVTAIP